ncbi:MAG: histidine kinase [Bacteroidales bacterium]|nr:histidine kinase [Bacteroidales bacterium]
MQRNINSLVNKILIILAISLLIALPASNLFPLEIALLMGGITAILIILLFILNEYWLIPRYFFLKKRTKFLLLNIFLLVVLTMGHYLLDELLVQPHKIYEEHTTPPAIFLIIRSLFLFLMANFISITLYLSNTVKKQAIREKNLKEEKLGTELKLLKAQINPHFIFNALNNIYALTYTRSEKAPESVLKLSEMLRYVFYDCSKDMVKLREELEYIENFISFQQMKSEDNQHITLDYRDADQDMVIAPMLFIPLIENAFKFSKIEEDPDAYVKIIFSTDNEVLSFLIENSTPQQGKPQPGQGLGIPNVKQRLKVLYPKRHELNIDEKNQTFTVKLKIHTR